MFSFTAAVNFPELETRVPVSFESILLRGTVIRNTEWVIGLVIMAGPDTKIVLNSSGAPSKRSKVERQMNPLVFINLGILALMCIFNGIATYICESYYYRRNSYWTVGSDLPDDNPRINGLIGFANALVTYQNIVPISLYISIEFVRTAQAFFIWADDDLAIDGRRTLARSWNLSDDLGQIQYIFSDKTGTLTQNLMQFRKCCIGGVVYGGLGDSELTGGEDKAPSDSGVIEGEIDEHKSQGVTPSTTAEQASSVKRNRQFERFFDRDIVNDLVDVDTGQAQLLRRFFTCLGLCHTVLVSEDEHGSIQYKAQSPDEAALVQAAADVGFVFRGRDKNVVRLQMASCLGRGSRDENIDDLHIDDATVMSEYELLEVNEFTSMRKRMSVVVQELKDGVPVPGELYLLIKGADNVIFERLASGQAGIMQETDAQLENFAADGLRTLCLAYRKLDRAQIESWSLKYAQARGHLGDDREQLIMSVQDELEHDLILLGATAIEDKLQDGVPEAIDDLKRAGIKVWVATGDKLETAVAIAKSCRLIENEMNLIVVRGGAYGEKASAYDQIRKSLINFFDGEQFVDDLKELPPNRERRSSVYSQGRPSITNSMYGDIASLLGEDNGKRTGGYGLVIDGSSLNHALTEEFTKEALLELSTRCAVVVCCRTSPKQKSEIVKLIKDGIQAQTLAIGDGANDVSMIQTADIGIGVSGEEGLQAVNASDYSIGQFKFISKLLFVHGHWSYFRNSRMICQFFFQQIIGIIPLFLYQFSCAYSTTTLFEYTYLLFYNIVWTLLPVIGVGVFEQNVREKVLKQVPELYAIGREGKLFTMERFLIYMTEGIYQGGIIYAFLVGTYNSTSSGTHGFDISMDEFSTVVIVAIILACNLFHALIQFHWNWWVFGGILFGPVIILLYTAVYAAIPPDVIWTTVYGNNHFLWPSAYWWFGLLFSVVISLMPRFVWKYYQETYHPTDMQILREIDRQDPGMDFKSNDRIHVTKAEIAVKDEKSLDELAELDPRANEVNSTLNLGGAELVRSRTSLMHDMATGQLASPQRGFIFDQADGVGECAVGSRLRRYNSSVMSLSSPLEARVNSTLNQFSKSDNELASHETRHRKPAPKLLNLENFKLAFGPRENNPSSSQIAPDNRTRGDQTSDTVGSSKKSRKQEEPKDRFAKRITEFLMQPYPGHKEKKIEKPIDEESETWEEVDFQPETEPREPNEIQEIREDQPTSDGLLSPDYDDHYQDARTINHELDMIQEDHDGNEAGSDLEGRKAQ